MLGTGGKGRVREVRAMREQLIHSVHDPNDMSSWVSTRPKRPRPTPVVHGHKTTRPLEPGLPFEVRRPRVSRCHVSDTKHRRTRQREPSESGLYSPPLHRSKIACEQSDVTGNDS